MKVMCMYAYTAATANTVKPLNLVRYFISQILRRLSIAKLNTCEWHGIT